MRTRVLGVIAAALILAPASAQQRLPRPSQMPPPAGAQKGPPPAPPGQKAAPQQQAQPPVAPPAPYTALKVSPPKPSDDASLAAFRKELAAVAQKKDRPALARLVIAKDFFWLKEAGNAAGKKTGIEALATALSLAEGWLGLGHACRVRQGRDGGALSGSPEYRLFAGGT